MPSSEWKGASWSAAGGCGGVVSDVSTSDGDAELRVTFSGAGGAGDVTTALDLRCGGDVTTDVLAVAIQILN